jgi:hypothetical protein
VRFSGDPVALYSGSARPRVVVVKIVHASPPRPRQRGSSRMPSPGTDRPGIISTTARANGFVVALECISIADIARVPQYLDAGQQFDIARRAAGFHPTDAIALVGRGIFGPVLLQRVLRRRYRARLCGWFATRPQVADSAACFHCSRHRASRRTNVRPRRSRALLRACPRDRPDQRTPRGVRRLRREVLA